MWLRQGKHLKEIAINVKSRIIDDYETCVNENGLLNTHMHDVMKHLITWPNFTLVSLQYTQLQPEEN